MKFYKYQGTGNDFIIIDNREEFFPKSNVELIKKLCERRFGIGADGLILLENHETEDFKMVYYNSDGNESSMCGNGGRCITAFANYLKIIENVARFEAIDGLHHAKINEQSHIELQMQDVKGIKQLEDHYFLDTGSPHVVIEKSDIDGLNVQELGRAIRNSPAYINQGTNVNFVNQISDDTFAVRTYERGVEAETLSCGTGVTAVALAVNKSGKTNKKEIKLRTSGGLLKVKFRTNGISFSDIWLSGPTQQVFEGNIDI